MSSSPRDRKISIVLLVVSALSVIGVVILGMDDNPPGILLAVLAAAAFILAISHHWRSAGKYLYLLLGSFIALALFIALTIVIDLNAGNPSAPRAFQSLAQSPVFEVVSTALYFLLPVGFLAGAIGALVMFLRRRKSG